MSPAASGSNYFSMSHDDMNRLAGNNQNPPSGRDGGGGDLSELISASSSTTNTRFEQFQFGSMEFDPNFNFDSHGFF